MLSQPLVFFYLRWGLSIPWGQRRLNSIRRPIIRPNSLGKIPLSCYGIHCIPQALGKRYLGHVMSNRISELCQQIIKENDPEKLKELARELDFALSEYSLNAQNKMFAVSQKVAALQ